MKKVLLSALGLITAVFIASMVFNRDRVVAVNEITRVDASERVFGIQDQSRRKMDSESETGRLEVTSAAQTGGLGSAASPATSDDDIDNERNAELSTEAPVDWHHLESELVYGRALVVSKVADMTSSERYREVLDAIRGETDEHKKSEYSGRFTYQPETNTGSVVLRELECGSRLCFVSAFGDSEATLDGYLGKALDSTSGAPIHSVTRTIVEVPEGFEARLVFSTDPEIDSISGF